MTSHMKDACDEWKARWTVVLVCRGCESSYEVDRSTLNLGLERLQGFGRLVLFPAPEVCPKCRNLRLAPLEAETEPGARP